jgi:hypothetical protein
MCGSVIYLLSTGEEIYRVGKDSGLHALKQTEKYREISLIVLSRHQKHVLNSRYKKQI